MQLDIDKHKHIFIFWAIKKKTILYSHRIKNNLYGHKNKNKG